MKIFFLLKLEIFFNENHPPTRHKKYKKIDFVPCKKSVMANKLRSTNLERFCKTDYISAYALIARIISRVNCPKLVKMAKMAIFKPS